MASLLKVVHISFRDTRCISSAVNTSLRAISSSSTSSSRGVEEQTSPGTPSSDTKSSPSPPPPPSASGNTDPISKDEELSAEQKMKSQLLAEKDAELLAKMQGRDGGHLAVEPGEWNGLAKNVKDNMIYLRAIRLKVSLMSQWKALMVFSSE